MDKIAKTPEDRLLLAKAWDKIHSAMQRNIPGHTGFLSPREQELCQFLFGNHPQLHFFGGTEEAERKMLCFLPDYWEESFLWEDGSPIVCLRANFYKGDTLTHRDILGALMGLGIRRETVGDIHLSQGSCDFLVAEEIAPFLLQDFKQAGRTHLTLTQIPLSQIRLPEMKIQEISDTVSSLRLDSVISSGFRISRSTAAELIEAGKAAIDGLPCEKPDKTVCEGNQISLRGYGKIRLHKIGGQTKKGRISVMIHRYL